MIDWSKLVKIEEESETIHRTTVRIPEHLAAYARSKGHSWMANFIRGALQADLENNKEYRMAKIKLLEKMKADLEG